MFAAVLSGPSSSPHTSHCRDHKCLSEGSSPGPTITAAAWLAVTPDTSSMSHNALSWMCLGMSPAVSSKVKNQAPPLPQQPG
jgi:hypothetical protein